MAGTKQRLLTDEQHSRCYDAYMREKRTPEDVASILNAEFQHEGLNVTPKQISTYAYERGWSKRRKIVGKKAERQAGKLVAEMAQSIAERKAADLELHKGFLDTSAEIGAKALKKASEMIEASRTPRDLSSAVNAARTATEIYREAVGLGKVGAGGAGGTTVNNYFNFSRSGESPFAAKKVVDVSTETDTSGPDEIADEPAEE